MAVESFKVGALCVLLPNFIKNAETGGNGTIKLFTEVTNTDLL
jgi:hypothetical protein